MNQHAFNAICSMALGGLLLATSCASDPVPSDFINNRNKGENAYIRLNLDVEQTRTVNDQYATDEEEAISKVNIYIFGSNGLLEKKELNKAYTAGTPLDIETTAGNKTIYAVTANEVAAEIPEGTPIEDFENWKFNSSFTDLKTDDGFVMIGKSQTQRVDKSASADDKPASNTFAITLTRAIAKAQVKYDDISLKAQTNATFGVYVKGLQFKTCQTNSQMYHRHSGTDIMASYTDANSDGAYDNYSITPYSEDFITANKGAAFTGNNCQYLPENIVADPVCGNTSYIVLKATCKPATYHYYRSGDSAPGEATVTPAGDTRPFFTVGIPDRNNGVIDYALNPSTKVVYAFLEESDATLFAQALNGGTASAITVSESQTPAGKPSKTRSGEQGYEVFSFPQNYAYYRINIAHAIGDSKTFKVVRNNFYKIIVKSIKMLGMPTEDWLRPLDPTLKPDTEFSTWVDAALSVSKWDETDREIDL